MTKREYIDKKLIDWVNDTEERVQDDYIVGFFEKKINISRNYQQNRIVEMPDLPSFPSLLSTSYLFRLSLVIKVNEFP
jgi:hypothetical protein